MRPGITLRPNPMPRTSRATSRSGKASKFPEMSFSLDILEFQRLLELVSRYAQTPMGANRVLQLQPMQSRIELDSDLQALSEAMILNDEKLVSWSFSGLEDPGPAI